MRRSKKTLSVLLIVVMLLGMFSTVFVSGAAAEGDTTDKFCFRPFKVLSSAPRFSTMVKTGVVFVCNDSSWVNAKDGEYVYIDYGVNPGDEPECYKLIKGDNAFDDIQKAIESKATSTAFKIGPGQYTTKVAVNRDGITFYGNYAGINPNADFATLENFYEVPQNPARLDSGLESVVTATWNWQKTTSYITVDGFTVTAKGQFFASFSGGNCSNNAFYNNIFTGSTTYGINCDYGTNYNTIVKYNRIVDSTTTTNLLFGAAFFNLDLQYNYFANLTGQPFRFTSIGNNNGTESQLNVSNNIFNNCSGYLNYEFDHSHGGKANFAYFRITDNVMYKCGGTAGRFITINYHPDQSGNYDPNTDQMDPGSKTYIANNTFYAIPSGAVSVKLNGAETIKSKTFMYKVSVIDNSFVFASEDGGTAIQCSIGGALDASRNFYGHCKDGIGSEKALLTVDNAVSTTEKTTDVITKPYYLDYARTTLSAIVTLQPGAEQDIIDAGLIKNGVSVDNNKMEIVMYAADGVEKVDLSKTLFAENTSIKVYKDFLLTNEAEGALLDLTGDQTIAYLIATNDVTKSSTSYKLSIISKTDKTLCDLKDIVYAPTDTVYTNTVVNGKEITVNLDTLDTYFPFDFVISPSASYKIYTDEKCETEYEGNWYIKPDVDNVFYTIVTSGDGKHTNKYKLIFKRDGSDAADASIISAKTPTENIIIFNNERKRVTFRPVIMANEVVFDFNVTDNATYAIYSDEAMTQVVSTKEEPKAIMVPDAISYFYINVKSEFGYEQSYKFVMYNDVRSTDNNVYGVSGIDDAVIDGNNITIYASNTLAVVNAHFVTNDFATVKLYADVNKTFEVEPSLTYKIVNKREVPVATYQLGNEARTSYFYLTVTSETGVSQEYFVKLVKLGVEGAVDFADISDNYWAKKYIDEVSTLGIMSGTGEDGSGKAIFNPGNNITRQEVAAVLCNMMAISPYSFRGVAIGSVFKDANNIPEWSYNYIKAVYALDAMRGSVDAEGNCYFNFDKTITREQFFVSIAGILKLDLEDAKDYSLASFSDASQIAPWALPYAKALVKAGLVSGSNGKLNPRGNISRAEVATIIAQCHGHVK